jgi:hypothetical protein
MHPHHLKEQETIAQREDTRERGGERLGLWLGVRVRVRVGSTEMGLTSKTRQKGKHVEGCCVKGLKARARGNG